VFKNKIKFKKNSICIGICGLLLRKNQKKKLDKIELFGKEISLRKDTLINYLLVLAFSSPNKSNTS
jgi:hypothetical protein